MELRIVEFSAAQLPHVQDFECGSDDWCLLATRWIQSAPPFPGALQSIEKHGNTVWLYFVNAVAEEFLVGFSSLGITKWPIPPPDGPRREVGFVPMLAVASRFQGKPNSDDGKRYTDEMMEHVVQQARERGYRELCLFLHADNTRALRLYERYGFEAIGEQDERRLIRMFKRLN